ncbi:MAG TPA: glycosyltransferase family 2 protein, partial [Dokdonella sp.]|nr:glycosyltransferase family 2 protein [Dokdonella sp.]
QPTQLNDARAEGNRTRYVGLPDVYTEAPAERDHACPPVAPRPRPCGPALTSFRAMRRIAVPSAAPVPVTARPPALRAADCLAVIPARDEAATVGAVVAGVRRALGCAVLVVDDASADGTGAAARAAGAESLRLTFGLGAWGATQTGIRYAQRNGYAGVITLDADGQHEPDSLPALFEAQRRAAANIVIGTCVDRLSRAKRVAWLYLRALTGLGLTDFTSGLRLYDAKAMAILAGPEASLLDYQDVGVLMLLAKNGLRIEETPVSMLPRREGHSRVFASWPVVARYMMHTTVLCLAQIDAGRRKEKLLQERCTAC